jgi:uncharacterized protein YjbI with pentapeptide repeats
LRGAVFNNVDAGMARFENSDLRGATLGDGSFAKASFRDADLRSANLAGADFDGADMKGSDLRRANLHGTDLSGARGLTQSQLDGACGDSRTRTPRGLTIRACGVRVIIHREIVRTPQSPPAPPAGPRYLITSR